MYTGLIICAVFIDLPKPLRECPRLVLYTQSRDELIGHIHALITGFLTSRFSSVGTRFTKPKSPIAVGILQGLVLTALLFLLNINDVPEIDSVKLNMFPTEKLMDHISY